MNIAALSNTGLTATYRIIAEQGFHPADFNLIRNFWSLFLSLIWCYFIGVNPLNSLPKDKRGYMVLRCLSGQGNFVLLNMAAPLAPISLIMVMWQTSPFWISIVAFCMLSEPIIPLEVVAMMICFGAVITIAM